MLKQLIIFASCCCIGSLGATLSLSTITFSSYDTNVIVSTYHNSYDALVALGVLPTYQNKAKPSLGLNTSFPYMKKFVNESHLSFPTITSNPSSGLYSIKQLHKFQTDTLILNEWARVDEEIYLRKNAGAHKIMYTSMADSINSINTSKKDYEWHTYNDGLYSSNKALMMLAKQLDERFEPNLNQTFSSYSARAQYIIDQSNERIKAIADELKTTSLHNKTIGIFAAQNGSGGYVEESKLTAIYDPFIYSAIYGTNLTDRNNDFGMGVKFPKSNAIAGTQAIKFADENGSLSGIKAVDQGTLLDAYKNKFDYIIFVTSPNLDNEQIDIDPIVDNTRELIEKFNLSEFLTTSLNNSHMTWEETKKRILPVNYLKWYPTVWGPIGVDYLLDEVVKAFNYFLANNSISNTQINQHSDKKWVKYAPNDLIKPEKKKT